MPRYGTRSLAEVLPSVAHALGDHTFDNALQFAPMSQAVVLVVDGLGWEQVLPHLDELPNLGPAVREQEPIDAAFPTTTPAGLATLTLAMPPGQHGFVGATFFLPDFETVLSPLHWDDDPLPEAVQPEPTVFRRLHGITAHRHGPAQYADTGMTRTLLAGATAFDHETFDPIVVERRASHLDYVYLPKLDKLGHIHGANSPKWLKYLREIDALVAHAVVIISGDRRQERGATEFAIADDIDAAGHLLRHHLVDRSCGRSLESLVVDRGAFFPVEDQHLFQIEFIEKAEVHMSYGNGSAQVAGQLSGYLAYRPILESIGLKGQPKYDQQSDEGKEGYP